MKYVFIALMALVSFSGCVSSITPAKSSWVDKNTFQIRSKYVEVNTWEGPRGLRGGVCTTFRFIETKEEYGPGEFYMSHDCGIENVRLNTDHYKGSIRVDRKKKVIVVAMYFSRNEPFPANGKYRYADF